MEQNPRKFLNFLARKLRISKILAKEPKKFLDFLARSFLDFWHFFPTTWQLFLARFARFCKIFQDRGKKSKKIFGVLGNKSRNNQNLGKRNKKVLHQSNTRSIDILKAIILENSRTGYLCVCFYLNLNLAWPLKKEAKINWNKMEAKIKHFGMKIMVPTSSVKMCDFLELFWV